MTARVCALLSNIHIAGWLEPPGKCSNEVATIVSRVSSHVEQLLRNEPYSLETNWRQRWPEIIAGDPLRKSWRNTIYVDLGSDPKHWDYNRDYNSHKTQRWNEIADGLSHYERQYFRRVVPIYTNQWESDHLNAGVKRAEAEGAIKRKAAEVPKSRVLLQKNVASPDGSATNILGTN